MYNALINGDCLKEMKSIPDNSIDMILCDLPYGTTVCKWDVVIPFNLLWEQYKRILNLAGSVVLTAGQPFSSVAVLSNTDMFKYSLVWEKSKVNHFAQAPYRFLTTHEDILIFSRGGASKNAKLRMIYNPQDLLNIPPTVKRGKGPSAHRPVKNKQPDYIQTKTGYPKSILKFSNPDGFHPTQKPVALFEYLIRTYTNEGMTVLDNCSGSGTTAIACINTNRNYVCIERDPKYFAESKDRIEKHWLKDIL